MNDLDRLIASVDQFCGIIDELPAEAFVEQKWGPKEILAHLVLHHELYVNLVEAQLEGIDVTLFTGRFSDLNAYAVALSRDTTTATLIYRLVKANHDLITLYRQNDPHKIRLQIKAGAKMRTLASLVPEVEAHIRNHGEKLRKQFTTRRKVKEKVA